MGAFVGQAGALVVGATGDELGILGILLGALPDLGDERLLELREERLRHLFGDRDLVDVDADLAGVGELEEGDFAGGVLEVRVLADHAPVASFTAEFQGDRREVLGRFGQDVLAHGRRAGVEDLVETLRQAQVGHVVSAVDEGEPRTCCWT